MNLLPFKIKINCKHISIEINLDVLFIKSKRLFRKCFYITLEAHKLMKTVNVEKGVYLVSSL